MQTRALLPMAPLLIGVVAMFFYVFYRSFAIFNRYPSKRLLLVIALVFSGIAFFSIWYGWESVAFIVLWTFCSWGLVLAFILCILFAIEHLISVWYKVNPFISVWVIACVLALWVFFSLHTKITHLDITSEKIDDDVKILLVSDIHVDYVLNRYHLRTIWKLIEQEQPNMVIIAWDLLNRPHPWYIDAYKFFQEKNYNIPIIAIMGNHDVMWTREVYQKISEVSPIEFLDNQSVEIDGIQIVWIVDKSVWGKESLKNNLDETAMDMSWEPFTILMTHQPIALEKLEDYPIDLEVAWHTHRGQIYWFRKVVELMNDYDYWKFEKDWKIAFVTQGIWTWGLPFRLWTQSEAVIINLRSK